MVPVPGLAPGPPALEEPRSVLMLHGHKVDSCVGLAPTNDRVAAGRFGFFSLQEEMVRRPGNAPGWGDARLFSHRCIALYKSAPVATEGTVAKVVRLEGFAPSRTNGTSF